MVFFIFVQILIDYIMYANSGDPDQRERERHTHRGGSRISGMGDHMYKSVGFSLCRFYLILLKYPLKMK